MPLTRKAATSKPKSSKKGTEKKPYGFLGRKRPLAMILYGPSGVGKTSFAAQFPDPLFLVDTAEEGILDLIEYKQVTGLNTDQVITCKDAQDTKSHLVDLAAGDHPKVRTVILDSLTGFEKYIFAECCREEFDNDWSKEGFYSYQQGPEISAQQYVPDFISHLHDVNEAGINVICIAHSIVKPTKLPSMPSYDSFQASLHKKSWECFHRWSQAILFLNYEIELEDKETAKAAGRTKRSPKPDGDLRYLYCQKAPQFDAKNRYGLPSFVDASTSAQNAYKNFFDAMKPF